MPQSPAQESPSAQPAAQPANPYSAFVATQILTADDFNDSDSAFGDDSDVSTTASIASSIYKFREENGRTYNAYGDRTYWMPNDEPEKDRLDMQHHLFQLTFGGNIYNSPIDKRKVHRVLDVGTGTGIWAIDYADQHPEAQVIGVDLSPIQPQFVPPNLQFEIDDIEKPWSFTKKFDFIFSRMMTGSFPDWPTYIKNCFDHSNPGAYLEIQDIVSPPRSDDDTFEGCALQKWGNFMLEATSKLGSPINSAVGVKKMMEDAGYVDVVEVVYKWPSNRWPRNKKMKEIGAWTHEATITNLSGMSVALFTRALGWTNEELEIFLADVRKDMKNPRIHAYWPIYNVYGRKPE